MKKTLIIAAAVLGLVSCSKEKKLEMRLDNQEWNIDKYKFELANNGVVDPGQVITADNVGTFKLDKGGTGTAQYNAGGNARAFTITKWTTGIDSVKLELTDQSTQGKETWNMSVTKNEKKAQEWYRVVKKGNFEFRYTFTLSRKK
jgi:hypothetical protein